MPNVAVYHMDGTPARELALDDAVFGIEPNAAAVHQVVVALLANRRQGTQSALTRAEVSGGGIKPWRQKGTGRARQGSTRSPQWRHGGVVFAPKPRSYRQSVNKKVRRLAMRSVLSQKVAEGAFLIVDEFAFPQPRTKTMVSLLAALNATGRTLLVLPQPMENVELSARNLQSVKMTLATTLNVYDILNAKQVLISEDAAKTIAEVFAV